MKHATYETIADATRRWIEANFDQFMIVTPRGDSLLPYKPVCELALLADSLLLFGDGEMAQLGRRMLERAWLALEDGAALTRLLELRADMPMLLMAYPSFRRHGMESADLDRAIRRFGTVRGNVAVELPGWCKFGLARLFVDLAATPPWPPERCFVDSWLGALPEPWSINRSSAYAVTHAVFYATDNGAAPEQLASRYHEYLRDWLPVWIRQYHDAENADLLAELILVARCLRLDDEDDWSGLLRRFLQGDGSLRGPEQQVNLSNPTRQRFLNDYHTTLVGLSAAAMSLRLLYSAK